jgi:predicted metalloprotease with PDZ domain
VLAGEFFRAVPLASKWPAELDVTGDSQPAVDKADDAHAFSLFARLIDEDEAMFGFRHWQKMHLLISQSDALPYDGLEHEDSPWDAMGDAGLSKKEQLEESGWNPLAHEQSHSWDGKYRRPAELYSKPDYQGPERATMLWVYEGLNGYIGMLLATRAGFNDADYIRDYLARAASDFGYDPGRAATPLADTAFDKYVYEVNPEPPTDGLEAAGWHVVYNATPVRVFYPDVAGVPTYPARASLGMDIEKDGTINDVILGTPAYKAGLGPNMKILSVDGSSYTPGVMDEAISHPKDGKISLVVRNFDGVQTREIQYAGGLRYPHLERISGSHDYLSEILAPRSGK